MTESGLHYTCSSSSLYTIEAPDYPSSPLNLRGTGGSGIDGDQVREWVQLKLRTNVPSANLRSVSLVEGDVREAEKDSNSRETLLIVADGEEEKLSKHSISLLMLEMSHAYSRDNVESPSNLRVTINQAITYGLNSILTKHQVLLVTHRKENGIMSSRIG
ncbi:hypothetical protein K435DRAFT_798211 [Dendrothele bispora CBS 962.96]|uniref:Uncharacterized protein n=1 Tax=Dendrothele bispora (strain CBS 962.96) TaxID=1314807 RepID=A0A4S8LZY0_DENBC|nr:hypothetical protein K435DRAFT_798211 [Dendrothele bispora CBS 962.96]